MKHRSKNFSLYCDGGSRGNPGPAAIGGLLINASDEVIAKYSERIGVSTNNVAEYRSLIRGMSLAHDKGISTLRCYSDSELIVNQMNFVFRVKDRSLAELFKKAHDLRQTFTNIQFTHIPREKNTRADLLVNRALDTVTP